MLIPEAFLLELGLVGGLVDLFEDILEPSIVFLKDGVLGAHVEWESTVKSILEAGVSKLGDGLISVVHTKTDAWSFKVKHSPSLLSTAILGVPYNFELAWPIEDEISSFVLPM